jgi:hypothetical protein
MYYKVTSKKHFLYAYGDGLGIKKDAFTPILILKNEDTGADFDMAHHVINCEVLDEQKFMLFMIEYSDILIFEKI